MLLNDVIFPDLNTADESGLLAIGGDLSVPILINAYCNGIFPWYNENEPICWYSPDPRFVLFPNELKISKSMTKVMQQKKFQFKMNTVFEQVILNCSRIARNGQEGTWIHEEVIDAYIALHRTGIAVSAEAWMDSELVGGLYGIRLGNYFFGESMFSKVSNASKFAFISMLQAAWGRELELVDCQVYTAHLESLGARSIPRTEFLERIQKINKESLLS